MACFSPVNNGTFDAATDADFVPTGGGTQGFSDAGSFTKSAGAAATSFLNDVPFHNTGMATVERGTLSLAGGGTSTGVFDVFSGSFVSRYRQKISRK